MHWCNNQPVARIKPILTQDETWQSLRVGVSAVATIWDRWGINGDVAYLPYAQYSGLDSHWQRTPTAFYPQTGTSRGVQAELILTYLVTENIELGIGGRYWAMWTTSASSELRWRVQYEHGRGIHHKPAVSIYRQRRALRHLRANELPVRPASLERDKLWFDRHPALAFCLSMIPRVKPEGVLFGKPVSTHRVKARGQAFPHHALSV